MLIVVLLLAAIEWPAAAHAQGGVVTGAIQVFAGERPAAGKPGTANGAIWLTPVGATPRDGDARPRPQPLRLRVVQQHKRFDPRIIVAPVGSVIEFPNLDPFFHNVFSLFDGKRFDLGLYQAETTHSVRFDQTGVCYVFCNIHPEMSAVVVIVDTPHYAISNRTGEFSIPQVPPGRYTVSVWHERCQPETLKEFSHEVTVTQSGATLGTIRLADSGDLLSRHKNKYGYDYERPNPPGVLYEQP